MVVVGVVRVVVGVEACQQILLLRMMELALVSTKPPAATNGHHHLMAVPVSMYLGEKLIVMKAL